MAGCVVRQSRELGTRGIVATFKVADLLLEPPVERPGAARGCAGPGRCTTGAARACRPEQCACSSGALPAAGRRGARRLPGSPAEQAQQAAQLSLIARSRVERA